MIAGMMACLICVFIGLFLGLSYSPLRRMLILKFGRITYEPLDNEKEEK